MGILYLWKKIFKMSNTNNNKEIPSADVVTYNDVQSLGIFDNMKDDESYQDVAQQFLKENMKDLISDDELTGEDEDYKESLPNEPEESETLFSIMGGQDDDEFYTFYPPVVYRDTIMVVNAFKKGVVVEEVLGEPVEEYFRSVNISAKLDFLLAAGVLLKQHNRFELPWLTRSESDARNIIKDKIILKFQQVVPNLVTRLQTMEARQKQNTARNNNSQNEELLDL